MAFIDSIDIIKFRGIKKLAVSELSNINLIVGDNNSARKKVQYESSRF